MFSDDSGEELFRGNIFGIDRATEGNSLELTCYDNGIFIKKNKGSYTFKDTTPEAVAGTVCADFGIAAGELAAPGHTFSRVFFNVSLYDIILTGYKQAANNNGKAYMIRFAKGKMSVAEMGANRTRAVIRGKSNLMSANYSESIESMVNRVLIYSKDDELINTMDGDTQYGVMQEIIKESEEGKGAEEAAGILKEKGVKRRATVENLGDSSLIAGDAVIVQEEYTGLTGLFYIESDTHTWKNGVYVNKLVLAFENMMDANEAGSEE
jgi:hypothetical protein